MELTTVKLEREDAGLVFYVSAGMVTLLRKGKVEKEKHSTTSHFIQWRFDCEGQTAKGVQLLGENPQLTGLRRGWFEPHRSGTAVRVLSFGVQVII